MMTLAQPSFVVRILACLFGMLLLPQCSLSQEESSSGDSLGMRQDTQIDVIPKVPGIQPVLHGLNGGVTFAEVHDSSLGWFTSITPAISYKFNGRFSMDLSASLFPIRNTRETIAPESYRLISTNWDAGDTFLAGHYQVTVHKLSNTTTAAMTLPSGSVNDGLSTGRVTFDLSDHMERYFGQFGALLDIGGGDSSAFSNNLLTKDYSTLGAIVHFQVGAAYWFPRRTYLQSIAYEQLPLGDQKIYTTIGDPNGLGPSQTFVSGQRVYEDNGFTTSFGTPVSEHLMFTSYYNRSRRLHLDTASVGLTFAWKGTPIHHHLSLYDKAFLEGEHLLQEDIKEGAAQNK